jgi:hypothetical protein
MNITELNQRKSWLGAMLADALENSFVVSDEQIIEEHIGNAIDYEFADEDKGGIMVFSTDINAVPLFKDKTEKYSISNWSVGNFFKGKYTDKNGKVYTEKSLSVEFIGVTYEQLIEIAEDLCREFKQETVLIKPYSTNKILLLHSEE